MLLKKELVLNNRNEQVLQAAKQRSIDFLEPMALSSQPDRKPPVRPPAAKTIMTDPTLSLPPDVIKPCNQVGSHENIAQSPISIVPKMTDPISRSLPYSRENIDSAFSSFTR